MENLSVVIDRMAEISAAKKALSEEYDQLQAKLLVEAEKELTDTKLKSVSWVSGNKNTAAVTISDTVSVVAGELLESIFGAVYPSMVEQKTTYTLKAPAKRILSAIWHIEKIVDENEVLAECKCLKTRDTLRRIKDSGLGELLRRCSFKNFECTEKWQETMKDGAVKFSCQDNGSFYIGGQSGSGKTHLCTAIIGAMIKRGKSARYFVWREDSVMLKALVNDKEYVQMLSISSFTVLQEKST